MKPDDMIFKIAERVSKLGCTKCGHVLQVDDYKMMSPIRCPACGTSQLVPGRMKNFLIIEVLGSGGMASVYRAYDQSLGRMVAIKVMRREMSEDPQFVQNFLREARSAAQLNHRNVVSIYSVDQIHDQPFIVMELLDGGRLDEWITRDEAIPEARLLDVARDIAEGLQAAGEIGLVHGDIKPANILFNKAGVAKVADFGIARFQARKLSKGEIWGTPYYIAPEKVRGQKEDLRSDIYSFGGTLFHAFSRVPPYDGPTATDVVVARIKLPPPNLAQLRADLHPETISMISRMLELEPIRRYPTYASLLSDIEAARSAVRASPVSASMHKSAPAAKKAKGGIPWGAVGIGAAVLAAAVGAFFLLRSPPDVPVPPSSALPVLPVPKATDGKTPLPIQPFSGAEQRVFLDIGVALTENNTVRAETLLLDFARQLPREHSGRLWVPVFHALAPWMQMDRQQTAQRLQKLDEQSFSLQSDGSAHPGFMAQAFGRLMLGKATELPELPGGAVWPAWAVDFAGFFKSYNRVLAGDLEGGRTGWQGYADRVVPADPLWPYSLQPLARKYAGQIQEWQVQSRDRVALAENPEKAPALLAEVERKGLSAPPWLRPSYQQEAERLRPQADLARLAVEKEAGKRRIQADLDHVDALRAKAQAMILKNDFAAALVLAQAETGFATEEGRAMLDATRESYRRMASLKPFLSDAVRTAPYRNARRELGGELVAASGEGIVIALPGATGRTEKSWSQVSPGLFAQITEHYLASARIKEDTRADLFLAAALHAYYNGATQKVRAHLQQALKRKPALLPLVHQLLPGVWTES